MGRPGRLEAPRAERGPPGWRRVRAVGMSTNVASTTAFSRMWLDPVRGSASTTWRNRRTRLSTTGSRSTSIARGSAGGATRPGGSVVRAPRAGRLLSRRPDDGRPAGRGHDWQAHRAPRSPRRRRRRGGPRRRSPDAPGLQGIGRRPGLGLRGRRGAGGRRDHDEGKEASHRVSEGGGRRHASTTWSEHLLLGWRSGGREPCRRSHPTIQARPTSQGTRSLRVAGQAPRSGGATGAIAVFGTRMVPIVRRASAMVFGVGAPPQGASGGDRIRPCPSTVQMPLFGQSQRLGSTTATRTRSPIAGSPQGKAHQPSTGPGGARRSRSPTAPR